MKHTRTCQRLYRDNNEVEHEIVDNNIHALVFAAGQAKDEVVDILLDIFKQGIEFDRHKMISQLLRGAREPRSLEQLLKIFNFLDLNRNEKFEAIRLSVYQSNLQMFKHFIKDIDLSHEEQDVIVREIMHHDKCIFLHEFAKVGVELVDRKTKDGESLLTKYLNESLSENRQGFHACELVVRLFLGRNVPNDVIEYHKKYIASRCGYANNHTIYSDLPESER